MAQSNQSLRIVCLLGAIFGMSFNLCMSSNTFASPSVSSPRYQTEGVTPDLLPVMVDQLKARMTYPMAWSSDVEDLAQWQRKGQEKLWSLTWQVPTSVPFDPVVVDEVDRGTYIARKVAFNLTQDSRVLGLLLIPKGGGPFPSAVFYHDHGARFDIGKEKLIRTWNDPDRLAVSQVWAERYFSGRFPGDVLAERGYMVLAVDALGWGDRGPMSYEDQQALAANMANLGSSMAGLMAYEDVRAAEFLAAQPETDAERVAAIGFSMGAFRAWQAAALSDAVKASIAINWMAPAKQLMVPGNNQLRGGSAWQMLHPGILRFLDYPDVASLAAPKPMLLLAGDQDPLFPPEAVYQAWDKMAKVWKAWGYPDRLSVKMWSGSHVFIDQQQDYAYDWLTRMWSAAP